MSKCGRHIWSYDRDWPLQADATFRSVDDEYQSIRDKCVSNKTSKENAHNEHIYQSISIQEVIYDYEKPSNA